jgi:hypothetical protein
MPKRGPHIKRLSLLTPEFPKLFLSCLQVLRGLATSHTGGPSPGTLNGHAWLKAVLDKRACESFELVWQEKMASNGYALMVK